jgi:hypothetical protein
MHSSALSKPWKRLGKNSKTVAEEILRLFFAEKGEIAFTK